MDDVLIERITVNSQCSAYAASDIGGREEQQDRAYIRIDESRLLAILCDGMGGCVGGGTASSITVDIFRDLYDRMRTGELDEVAFLYQAMTRADAQVAYRVGKERGGTTLAATVVHGDMLYWISAGDSRIYIMRDGELLQVTRDHNYFLRLSHLYSSGEISEERFKAETENGEALLSYIGKGGIDLFDLTRTGFKLCTGDVVLIMSDGLYKAIPVNEMVDILRSEIPKSEMADSLVRRASEYISKPYRDNATLITIFYN